MTKVSRIAANKPKLDMILLCISSQFGLVKFGWELSDLFWFGAVKFGLVWMSLVWYG